VTAIGETAMKIRVLPRLLGGLALLAASLGCNSDALTTVNDNPNNPTDAPPGPLFTSAVANGVRRWMGGYDFTETSAVVQHLAMNQYTDEDRYAGLRASATTGNLDGAYANELQDLRQLVVKGQAQSAPGIWGPARVMQSWEFQVMTVAFGDAGAEVRRAEGHLRGAALRAHDRGDGDGRGA
jgi:hypothetical protein